MTTWAHDAFFYHLYPLGTCGAPWVNNQEEPVSRILRLIDWIEPAAQIGCNAVLFGPIWESGTHGYDTHDYHQVDRRLGTEDDLDQVVRAWRDRGFRIVLDGVFNHCGRGFAPFQDLLLNGERSAYRDWFAGVDFSGRSPYGDCFSYDGWNGHYNLVKFNLKNPEVRRYLFAAVAAWMDQWAIDGLRIDAADVIDKDFLRELSTFCKGKNSDFWLLGEVIHGDYNEWAPGAGLDSVTNYELFKGLWSSHNDANYFEVAWTLNRQFGPEGIYRGRHLVSFGDNHDVNRLASTLKNPSHLYPHAILAATVPGLPTVYYGSEAGLPGEKTPHGDEPLRPSLSPTALGALPHQALRQVWSRLSQIRQSESALRTGHYRQVQVGHRQLSFWRLPQGSERPVLVLVNSDEAPSAFRVELGAGESRRRWVDLLNPGEHFVVESGHLEGSVWPAWGRILVPA